VRGIEADISRLSSNSMVQSRGEEILQWIEQSSEEDFVILDDDKSLNNLPFAIRQKLVLTSPLVGLNDEVASKAIGILKEREAVCA
jgi:hypothetical protein